MNQKHIKKIHELFDADMIKQYELDPNCIVKKISNDSRHVCSNTIFIAERGVNSHGADFITTAIEQGACLVLSETKPNIAGIHKIPIIYFPQLREYLLTLLTRFYELDFSCISIIAVTGTNGKTSVASMLAQSLNAAYIGTIGQGLLNALKPTLNTTPALFALIPFFIEILEQKVKACVLEMSSHALCQQRLLGLPIKTAIFTNLTHEHLDYHGCMEQYAKAKYRLFLDYPIKNAVICIDDSWGRQLCQKLPATIRLISYGLNRSADIHPLSMLETMDGIKCTLVTPLGTIQLLLPLIGQFNVLNAMAVIGALLLEEKNLDDISKEVQQLSAPEGRMDIVHKRPYFVVDYAHTPDALDKALLALKKLCTGALWCVFGCGGDRDTTKRPLMGKIAQHYADHIILTNDNPRNESPQAIAKDIQQGFSSVDSVKIILDRAQAINYCFNNACTEDVILVAGKGHEDYQIIGTKTHYFSDKNYINQIATVDMSAKGAQ